MIDYQRVMWFFNAHKKNRTLVKSDFLRNVGIKNMAVYVVKSDV